MKVCLLYTSIFRLVCTNGLIVGARIAAINIRHMGHTGEEVIAASLRLASKHPGSWTTFTACRESNSLTSDRWISFMMRPGCAWETTTKTGYLSLIHIYLIEGDLLDLWFQLGFETRTTHLVYQEILEEEQFSLLQTYVDVPESSA